ncbi:MAG: hypothetical protein U1E97_07710 [Alphaproteobacteria bacterium]
MSDRVQHIPAPWPRLTSELEPTELLLVEVFRRWLLGAQECRGQHWAMASNEFAQVLGAIDGRAGLASLAAIMRELGEHGRRPVRYHPVCCPCVSADELWLIAIVGACQRGKLDHAHRLAEWMVGADGIGDVLGAACHLATALHAHERIMPARGGRPARQGNPSDLERL